MLQMFYSYKNVFCLVFVNFRSVLKG